MYCKNSLSFLSVMLLCLLSGFIFSGCMGQPPGGIERRGPGERPEREYVTGPSAEQILGAGFMEELLDEGVYIISAGTVQKDGEPVLNITGYRMDQRAIRMIKGRIKEDIEVEIHESEEILFIEGTISEIETDEQGIPGKIFVEGSVGHLEESAHIFIADYTRILKENEAEKIACGAAELAQGQKVRVKIVGIVLTSLPPQASAGTISILSE